MHQSDGFRILRFVDRTQPPNLTAIGIHSAHLNETLVKSGLRVVTFTTKDISGNEIEFSKNYVRFPVDKSILDNRISLTMYRIGIMLAQRFNPTLIHSHSHLFYTSIIGSFIAKKLEIPHLLTIHGIMQPMGKIGNAVQSVYNKIIFRFVFSKSYFLVYSKHMLMDLVKLGVDPNKVTIIPNAILRESIDIEKFDYEKINRLKKSKPLKIAFIGRFIEGKGIIDILELISIIPKHQIIEFHLVGIGAYANSLLSNLRDKFSDAHVIYYGQISNQEVDEVLKKCSILLQPSKQEGVSRIILEALSKNCLVLANTARGLEQFIEYHGLLIPGKDENWSEFAKTVICNPFKYLDMVNWGHIHLILKEKHSWDNYVKQLMALITSILTNEN